MSPTVISHASLLSRHIRVDGIVFLHAITQGRQADIVPHRLELFYTLCRGNRALRLICGAESIVVATTKWIEIKPEKGLAREDQLREECWKDLLNRDGTSMCRFEDSQASAISIVSDIINVAQTPRCVPPLGGSATLALDKGHILRILAIRNLFRILSILRSI
ncbi:hypothetical protein H0H81_008315 [Sphagnurus paluster]|uniref:Uncharacterized protein n=1 Tax=Sphagnurus paluster TaxID=117069 RepID=A0A9P7GPW4_9AGAR|nr:hypothetical protein H0H81_008315 [Sphagnurus paluster]